MSRSNKSYHPRPPKRLGQFKMVGFKGYELVDFQRPNQETIKAYRKAHEKQAIMEGLDDLEAM